MGDEWAAFAYPVVSTTDSATQSNVADQTPSQRDYQEIAVMLYVKDGEKLTSPTWREYITIKDVNVDFSTAEPK